MYGQGTHGPMPPFQQRSIAPPPPPPPLQQGLSSIQQGPPPIPHNVGYSGSFVYQHAPSPPVPPVQVPTTGMLNSGLSYLPPPPPLPQQVRGSTSVPHPYPIAQQTSQWTQTTHHIPRSLLPPMGPSPTGPSPQEMFSPSMPPRVLQTLTSQGQSPYRGPIHLPPPPPTNSFFTLAPFGSFVHSAHQDSNEPSAGHMLPPPPPPPPPPPSSPPPLPPSPPPPTSPVPSFRTLSSTLVAASDLSHNSRSSPISNLTGSEKLASASVDKVVVTSQIRVDGFEYDDNRNPDGSRRYEAGSLAEKDLYNEEGTKLDLPSPPPKPAEEKVVQKIDDLCHVIARNGPSFEDIACQKECGNPEYSFLFGGEPGSEAAIAHGYFEWMKNKCILASKLQCKEISSALRLSDNDTSTQTYTLIEAGVSHSTSDSDMEMEDDITQLNEEQRVYNSFEGLNNEDVLIPKEFPEKLCIAMNAIEPSLAKDAMPGSSGLAEGGKGSKHIPDHDHVTNGRSLAEVDSSVTNSAGVIVSTSNSNLAKLSIPQLEDSSQCNVSAVSSEKFPGELIKSVSPFRLIQGYASDDSSEDDVKPCLENVSPVATSPSTTAAGLNLHGDLRSNLQPDTFECLSNADMAFGTFSESVVPCSVSMPSNALGFFPESRRSYTEVNIASIAAVKTEELIENNYKHQEPIENAVYPEAPEPNDPLDSICDAAPEIVKAVRQKEDVKHTSALPKVDEFGRLVREGASDSDSDEGYTGGRGKRRRSVSQSQSPHDRRRRRRSPLRRREKRSRSRSWSPTKRRSRSKSPSYRRGAESIGDKMRKDKGRLPECFDFLRGRCYRGAFCRYMHHDSEKTDGGRRYRSKQQYAEVPPVSETSDFLEENVKSLDREKVLVSAQQSVQTIVYDQEDESLDIDMSKSERSTEVTAFMHETQDIKEEILEPTTEILDKEICAEIVETVHPVDGSPSSHGLASSQENLVIPHSQANPSLPVLQNAFDQPSDVDGSSMSGSSPIQTSTTFQNQHLVSAPHLNKTSPIQSYPGTSSSSQLLACDSFSSQILPPKELVPPVIPSLPSLSQSTITPSPPRPLGEIMQPPSNFPPFYPPIENCPPNQVLLQNQHSYFAIPPNSSWSLPPPPPLPPRPPFVDNSTVTSVTATQSSHWSQFQQNQLPPRPSSHMGDFKLNPQPMVNSMSQPFGGSSFAQGNIYLQHVPSTRDSTSFQNHPHLQQQRTPYGLQQPGADRQTVNKGDYGYNNSTVSRYTDLIDRNQLSNLSDFGGSRISNHYNPYASTFDQPLTSKFTSNVLKQENDRPRLFDSSYSLSHVPLDGPGDQYDPLFDSIEPSSKSSKKVDQGQRRETMLSCSGSHKPLDVEENNKRKDVEAVAITTSLKSENDECGETADEEVGDVDNVSGSSPLDEGNAAVGEIEIDQIKTPGKRKKSKDSRSMKHFKVALANFVKDELKPSWRQGNLSKEAFKIIVKKIVDKVSGAMKSHHVPKSQSKINHYIDSSQRKLSKLVTGYLNKYAKG